MNKKNLIFSVSSIKNTSQKYLEKLNPLINIQENEKLIIDNDIIELDENFTFIQSFSRWWNNHNRISICNKLNDIFNNYFIFLKMIKEALESNNDLIELYKIRELEAKHNTFNKDLIAGLNNIKTTYSNCDTSIIILDNILNNLKQFTEGEKEIDTLD